uniref:Uncharacterized protein n=1 Tax=Timema cristinae TaxID=61476 RepID=A0A7R9GVF3_TIMCR|nr:unnamed protein product [Timema cristinae]
MFTSPVCKHWSLVVTNVYIPRVLKLVLSCNQFVTNVYIPNVLTLVLSNQCLHPHRYANRAKNIKNRARVNEDPKDALLRQFQSEIQELRKQLDDAGLPPHVNGDTAERESESSDDGSSDSETQKGKKKKPLSINKHLMTMDQLNDAEDTLAQLLVICQLCGVFLKNPITNGSLTLASVEKLKSRSKNRLCGQKGLVKQLNECVKEPLQPSVEKLKSRSKNRLCGQKGLVKQLNECVKEPLQPRFVRRQVLKTPTLQPRFVRRQVLKTPMVVDGYKENKEAEEVDEEKELKEMEDKEKHEVELKKTQ